MIIVEGGTLSTGLHTSTLIMTATVPKIIVEPHEPGDSRRRSTMITTAPVASRGS